MLTLVEKILFAVAVIVSLYFTYRGVMRIIGHIASGQGKPDWSLIGKRVGEIIVKAVFFQPVFRFRPAVSLPRVFIGWGFSPFENLFLFPLIASLGCKIADARLRCSSNSQHSLKIALSRAPGPALSAISLLGFIQRNVHVLEIF